MKQLYDDDKPRPAGTDIQISGSAFYQGCQPRIQVDIGDITFMMLKVSALQILERSVRET